MKPLSLAILATGLAASAMIISSQVDLPTKACEAADHSEADATAAVPSAYFAADYASARRKFLVASKRARALSEQIIHPLAGPGGEPMYTDIALVGSPRARRFLVLISGTHGVEGFAGSALQVGLLEEGIHSQLSPQTAVLMIHALNPYGMAYLRRFNEDNIDLNRNFRDHDKPPPDNPAYRKLADAIAPESISPRAQLASWIRLLWFRITTGKVKAKAAISGGQYTHPTGLFYGGRSEAWSNTTLRSIVARYLSDTQEVVVIDLHTALGGFGVAGLIPNTDRNTDEYQRAHAIWEPSLFIDRPEGETRNMSPQATVKAALPEMLPRTAVTAVTLEFGTFSSMDVFLALRAEHWLHHHGPALHPRRQAIEACLLRTYFPASEKWKSMVWRGGNRIVGLALSYLSDHGSGSEQGTDFTNPTQPEAGPQEVLLYENE